MGLKLNYIEGQTPLTEEEMEGLKISSITTRGELDEVEQLNIEEAVKWTIGKAWEQDEILTEKFIKDLHFRMFGNVWKWAGNFRLTNKNIGVDKTVISMELKQLIDDCKFWIDNVTYADDEIAIRFSHRIVQIHCFVNGNGRHSRLIADIIIEKIFEGRLFTWGRSGLVKESKEREEYLKAIRNADNGDILSLLAFSRS